MVQFTPRFAAQCRSLIESLPEWFGIPEANEGYLKDLARLPSWLVCGGAEVFGAATLASHFPGSFEVHFLAVRRDLHRQGIGRALLRRVEREAIARGGRWLHVKTLAPSDPDPHYARTRRFYEALGFSPLFESASLWPGNPAVILVKRLG